MSDRALTGWLSRRRESTATRQLKEHLSKVLDAVVEMDNALAYCLREDRKGVLEALKRLDINEKAADNLEVDLLRTLARGDLEPKQRESLMLLARRIDDISDHVKQAGLNLKLLLEWERRVPKEFWASFKEMSKDLVDTCRALWSAVEALASDERKVLSWREEVKKLEHRIDGHFFEIKKRLIRSSPDARAMTLLVDILNEIEVAADMAKEAADQLFILVLAGR
ncbi:MAG: DUF47 family protein [Candidatus Thermoplasmatota archaeon]|nr:DUF47 family protein [Candidatus Thermoplasmatota archaeon]